MTLKILLILATFILVLPSVSAQVLISSHKIDYELRGSEVWVQESFEIVNPKDSKVHTFNDDIVLLRGNIRDLVVTGVPGRLDNGSSPNMVYLEFSKSPIWSTAVQNTKIVTLTYITSDLVGEEVLDRNNKGYFLLGNVLKSFPSDIEVGETVIIVRGGADYQISVVLPQTGITDNQVSFVMSKNDRKAFPAFNVEVQYAKFRELTQSNINSIEERLEESIIKAEDALTGILNAEGYDANASKAKDDLNKSLSFLNESQGYLTLSQELFEREEYYSAYVFSNTSLNLADEAVRIAIEAKTEAILQLRLALNQKISHLENLTATITPAPTLPAIEKEDKEELETSTTTTTTSPAPSTTQTILQVPEKEGYSTGMKVAFLIVLFMAILIVILTKSRGKSEKQAVPKDFRSIADLKRKSFKDFEERMVDVKRETTIAGEIRKLNLEKKKYQLGIENLDKKKLSGEIGESVYNAEKVKFENYIKKLDNKVNALEKELPMKGGLDGKSRTDQPKKSG
jgi:hypothetical protein